MNVTSTMYPGEAQKLLCNLFWSTKECYHACLFHAQSVILLSNIINVHVTKVDVCVYLYTLFGDTELFDPVETFRKNF